MKCKKCQAELEAGNSVCPSCGEINEFQETPETQKATPIQEGARATPGKLALMIVAGVVVLAVLVALVVSGLGGTAADATNATTGATGDASLDASNPSVEPTAEPTVPADGNPDDATCKGTYTVDDAAAAAAADTVVATMGDAVLTNGELQAYYWMEYYTFLQNYGNYAAYFGLDYTQPLDVQQCPMTEVSMTWQQYFLQCALETWHCYQALVLQSEEEGFQLSTENQAYLDALATDLEAQAVAAGYADLAAQTLDFIGPGATAEDYVHYAEIYNRAYMYLGSQYDNLTPTAEEVDAYFTENEALYADSGVTRDSGKYVDVRHILVLPEGADINTIYTETFSDEAWAAGRQTAEDILAQWLSGEATEESFAALANEHSADPGSNTNGGLYTEVTQGRMVETFDAWCFDESRQVGDTAVVETELGYHVMYFSGSQDIWYATAEYDLISERGAALIPAAMEKFLVEVDYSAIVLGMANPA